ncbi:MAG: aldehyde dehydrogenase family protein, partial [Methanoregula sp.]
MKTYPVLVGGIARETGEVAEVRFPYTGEVYARACMAGDAELEEAVAASCRGFRETRRLPAHARSRILAKVADEIHRRAAELVDVLVMEGGKTKKFATAEVARAETTVRTAAEEAKRIYGEILPLDMSEDTEGRTGHLQR